MNTLEVVVQLLKTDNTIYFKSSVGQMLWKRFFARKSNQGTRKLSPGLACVSVPV